MTGPDAKLGAKISLAEGGRKRRVGKAIKCPGQILHFLLLYNLTYYVLLI
jgi:hypothetical protein